MVYRKGNMFKKSGNSSKTEKSPKRSNQLDLVEEVTRKRSEKDAATAIQICRRFLTIIGIWRTNDNNKFSWHIVLSNFLFIAFYFGFGVRTIPAVLYMFLDATDYKQICYQFARVLFSLMSWLKYMFLRIHRSAIEECMRNIEVDWLNVQTSANRDIMMTHSRYGLLVTRIIVTFTFTSAIWQAMLPYVAKRAAAAAAAAAMTNNNVTVVMKTVRTFPVASHFGFSFVTKTPIFEFIYTSQMVATFMMHSVAITCYSIAIVAVMHACGQLKILMEKINNLIDGDGEETKDNNVDNRISNVIRHHVRTLRFISSAEKMLREICLIDLCGCTIELCVSGYFYLVELREESKRFIAITAYLSLIITFTFNIFSFCYIGELLTQECKKVGEMTYMIDWYRLPGKQPLALSLIITMSHSPVTLTAGGTVQLSFRCFASVIKTSVGYLNMLRAVMD